jgi:LacI family transcriptional regulator
MKARIPPGSGSVTIKDVARHAKVSIATVSRALNTPDKVSDGVVVRVQAAARTLGYVPYRAARSLVSRRFNAVGAIVPTVDNAIFAKATQALQNQLNAHGYTLLLASTEYDSEREMAEIRSLVEHGVDGLVLVGAEHQPGVERLLEAKRIPFVNTWIYDAASTAPCIGFDNRGAMIRLTRYLLDLGHRRFAMIAGITRHNDRAAQRVIGVRETLTAHGLDLRSNCLIECPYTIADGRSALAMLVTRPQPPTAVICGNDVLAFGALFECLARGLQVPHDLSITGFDDLDLASHVLPPLTTMHVPAVEMGLRAADYLIARGIGNALPDRVELEPNLIVRGTTAPPSLHAGNKVLT